MTSARSSYITKKLLLRFIAENIDYRKRCLYLQEIISMGKANSIWLKALVAFFDSPMDEYPLKAFSKN